MGAWMTMTMAALALAFTACSEEDIMQPANGQSGSLHISSVIIDGQQVARSRVAYEGSDTPVSINNLPANHSITGFSEGDEIQLYYSFEPVSWELADDCAAKARFDGSSWTLSGTENMPATEESTFIIKPGNGEKWEDVKMYASVVPASEGPRSLGRQAEGSNTTPQYVLGDIDDDDVWQVTDCLYAFSEDGSIKVDTDLKSPTLGAVTIRFKHQDALLRLAIPESGFNVAGTYVVDGTAYNVTGLATLWAFLDGNGSDWYVPFTQVGNNLQAIVYDTYYTLAGFKAVLYTTASGRPGDVNYNESEVLTLDLPFKVGGLASEGIKLVENTQYPLTLNISPNQAEVNLASAGKPGWGDEDQLSNAENEKDLEYIATSKTFIVKTAAGLQHLNKWMTGTISTFDFKAKGFAGNRNITAAEGSPDALAMNITFMANITLDAPATTGGSNWTPIGTEANPYTGTIDGNGKTLGGMVINATEHDHGFVRYLGTNGQIKNLTFEDAQVASTEGRNVGIVAGVNKGMVDNCHTVGTSSVKAKMFVGGIVGSNKNVITNCTNVAQVAATSEVGGITGDNYDGFVSSCINSGSVIGTRLVGGIAGSQFVAEMIACGNTGSVSGDKQVGGIVGDNSGTVAGSWTIDTEEKDYDGEVADTEDGVGYGSDNANNIIECYSVANAAALNSEVDNMNTALWDYYITNNAYNKYYWTPGTNGGWPTLTTTAPASPAQGN